MHDGGWASANALWRIFWILREYALSTHEFLSEVTLVERGSGERYYGLLLLMCREVLKARQRLKFKLVVRTMCLIV